MVLTSTLTPVLGVLLNGLNLQILDIVNVHSKYQFDFMCFMFLLFLCLIQMFISLLVRATVSALLYLVVRFY